MVNYFTFFFFCVQKVTVLKKKQKSLVFDAFVVLWLTKNKTFNSPNSFKRIAQQKKEVLVRFRQSFQIVVHLL